MKSATFRSRGRRLALYRLGGGIRRHRRLIGTVAAILLPVLVLTTVLYTWLQTPPANPGGNAGIPTSTRIYDRNHVLLWQIGPNGSSRASRPITPTGSVIMRCRICEKNCPVSQ